MKRRTGCVWLAVWMLVAVAGRVEAGVFISEFLADPPGGISGDANQDGTTSSTQDEFVELYNSEEAAADLSGWQIYDSISLRHEFAPGTVIPGQGLFVVFGGGDDAGFPAHWLTASSGGLSLNNSGDVIILYDQNGDEVSRIDYGSEAGQNQSLVRDPEWTQGPVVLHTALSNADGQAFSPGSFVNAPPHTGAMTVPEPSGLGLLGLGLSFLLGKRRKSKERTAI